MDHVAIYCSRETAAYGFGPDHPFGPDRQDAFLAVLCERGLDKRVLQLPSRAASVRDLMRFHEEYFIEFVRDRCAREGGYLDLGDTPAMSHIFDAACHVTGASLRAAEDVAERRVASAFVPIGGLHHAGRGRAAGFCAFNDIGVVIEFLREAGYRRIAYVDIDAHHGDGVFYAYEDDPELIILDTHQDGRTLYPGTGHAEETGEGAAAGTKRNVPLPPGTDSKAFRAAWLANEEFLAQMKPEFFIFQCGADSVAGDPITGLALAPEDHGWVAGRLKQLADAHAGGRLLAMGGGGYNRRNIGEAWSSVVEALLETA